MKESYVIAQNILSVTVSDGIAAWEELEPRFRPFIGKPGDKSILEIDIKCQTLPECDSELIYLPEDAGIAFVSAQASRLADGCLIMEFRHIDESKQRVWMKMPPTLDFAEIILAPDGEVNDSYFLTHAIMIAFMLAALRNGTLLIHSSTILYEGKAYLFQGRSGTGKSTHASLWLKNIEGAELLNDDHPFIRFSPEGKAIAYGSPWSGKTHCYRNLSAPIGAFVRIVRDKENSLHRLSLLKAFASLSASVSYLPFFTEELKEIRHKTIERLLGSVPCFEMHCRPDADAAFTCLSGLSDAQAGNKSDPSPGDKQLS